MKIKIREILENLVRENITSLEEYGILINNQINNNKLSQDDIKYLFEGNYVCCNNIKYTEIYDIIKFYIKD
jgi:hypothetical protein